MIMSNAENTVLFTRDYIHYDIARIHVARLGSKNPGGVIHCKSDVMNVHKSCRFGLSRICSLQLQVLAMKISALFTAVLGTLILTAAGWCSYANDHSASHVIYLHLQENLWDIQRASMLKTDPL